MSLFLKQLILSFTLLFQLSNVEENNEVTLTGDRLDRANYIAEICIENWEEYGCLPSVCIAQGILESGLGEQCYPNNYWGLYGGHCSYDTLEDGVYAYMDLINTYFSSATYITDYKQQIQVIYNGGYCQSGYEYVTNIIWMIEYYNLTYYDEILFEKIRIEEIKDNITKSIRYYCHHLSRFMDEYGYIFKILDLVY